MKAFKIVCILLFSILTLLLSCSKKKPPQPEPIKYKWTILGYFDGNNSQDQAPDGGSYVLKDLDSLEQIGSTDDVQVLVMLGSAETDGNCKYYYVKTDSSEVLRDVGKPDMSNPVTLRDFIGYGMQNYPAEHYMLIINDHAGGWKGLCSDTINGSGNWMSLPDLSYALSGFEFDIIWFYTPSMATAEVAYQIQDRAKYMIASQFKWYPDNIMGSTIWLPYLTDYPDRNVKDFAWKVTQAIDSAAQIISPEKRFQSVLIHLPKIDQITTDVSNLCRNLIDSTGSYWTEVWHAWAASDISSYECDSPLVDLREFARQIQSQPNLNSTIKNYAADLDASVDEAVLVKFMWPSEYTRHSGISIYFPWKRDDFDSTSYAPLDFSATTEWHEFISVFIQSFSDSYAGALNIFSVPTGARVFLNGVDTGYETNVIIGGLFPGFYMVKLVKPGYQDWNKAVFVYPGQTTPVPAQL